ncbi:hypothetical protein DV737_g5233, partial [Chaetothyriales sp. CBS 132003]
MAISNLAKWEDIAAAKRAALIATIPPEWVIPSDIMPSAKQLDVTSFPKASGWFTPLELNITESTVSEILSNVKAGTWTARVVTSAFCKRAAAAHQLTNCLSETMFTEALEAADALDQTLARTGAVVGPLHGLPISIKDNFNVVGKDSTVGFVSWCNKPLQQNSVLVIPIPWRAVTLPKKLKLGVIWNDGMVTPSPPVQRALKATVQKLIQAGHEIVDWDSSSHARAYSIIGRFFLADGGKSVRKALESVFEPFHEKMKSYEEAKEMGCYELWQLHLERNKLCQEYVDRWAETGIDGIVSPTTPFSTVEHGKFEHVAYTAIWNVLDYSAVSFPSGFSADKDQDVVRGEFLPLSDIDKQLNEEYNPSAVDGMPSIDPKNQVFAIIRSRGTSGPLEELAAKRKNIHIVVTDISDPRKLEQAADEVSKVTDGTLDVLILNAGSVYPETSVLPPSAFHGEEEALEKEINENIKANLISNIDVINAFLDLVRKGKEKKIIFISSPSGDVEFNRVTGISTVLGYSVSKAGMNVVMTKFGAELAQEGIKTLSPSPGWVATDAAEAVTGAPAIRKFMLDAFRKLDPSVNGPIPVDESITDQLQVIQSLKEADSGKFVTHHGNNDWF